MPLSGHGKLILASTASWLPIGFTALSGPCEEGHVQLHLGRDSGLGTSGESMRSAHVLLHDLAEPYLQRLDGVRLSRPRTKVLS